MGGCQVTLGNSVSLIHVAEAPEVSRLTRHSDVFRMNSTDFQVYQLPLTGIPTALWQNYCREHTERQSSLIRWMLFFCAT